MQNYVTEKFALRLMFLTFAIVVMTIGFTLFVINGDYSLIMKFFGMLFKPILKILSN